MGVVPVMGLMDAVLMVEKNAEKMGAVAIMLTVVPVVLGTAALVRWGGP